MEALYLLDWDAFGARSETVTVTDAFGAVLDSREVKAFDTGKYLVWKLSGQVIIRITGGSADGAAWSGLFFE